MKWRTPLAIGGLLLCGCSLVGRPPAIEPLPPAAPLPLEVLIPGHSATTARAEFDQAELLLQACMAAEGFKYYPVEMDAETDVGSLAPENLIAFASDHGYGLTEQLLPTATALDAVQAGVLPHYVEFDLSEFGIIETDPNVLYAMSLTPEEGEAYLVALEGPAPDQPSASADYGCQGRVHDQMEAESRRNAVEQPQWLDEAMHRIDEEIQSATAEFAAVERRWAECMTDQGFEEFTERIDAPESIRLGILDIVLQSAELTDPLNTASVTELNTLEMSLAGADAGCYTTVYLPMSRGIEAHIQTEVLTDLGAIPNE